jgi:ligand-binding sensor domain-containing protein
MSFLSDLRLSPAPEPSRAGGLSWLLAAFCLVSSASAQYRLDVWTTDDGLPQNGIRAIHQTPDGYLWLVTFDGLVRFDGIRFTVFNKSNSPGIDSNRFDSLYEDRNGELWLGTQDGGVTRYRHGSFTTYTTLNGLPHNHVRGITGDDAGNLWVLAGDSIMQWQETTGRFIDVTPKDLRIPYWPLLWEGQGGFWGSDPAGIHCFRKGRFVTYPLPHWPSRLRITSAAEERNGTIWLETSDGKHARITNGNVEAVNANTPGKNAIVDFRDRGGNLWTMGQGHDLLRFIDYPSSGRLERLSFFSLGEDREGNLWFGTTAQGLCRLRRQWASFARRRAGPGGRAQTWRSAPPSPTTNQSAA